MVTAESGSAVDRNKEIIWRSDGNYVVDNFILHDKTKFCSECFKSGPIKDVYHNGY
ncbi:hypothetical protein DPMN_066640 [Dreissena polymorpha]|uniref:Uncharacterized protein n=1 Tax=Dreissena polymorpha TaxID=45954 RepID=A0A9D3YY84_DREPO|nr:hypothetical protein DPMN_066640 [Dreissena polymorpha]